MINHLSIISENDNFFFSIQHKFGQRAKILPGVLTSYIILFFSDEGKYFIIFHSITFALGTSVAHVPTSPNFCFVKY